MRTVILLGVTVIFLSGAVAQPQSGETFKAGVTVIQVPVVVRDHDGHVVSNLGKDDFQLFTDGKRQEITTSRWRTPGRPPPIDRCPMERRPRRSRARNGNGDSGPLHHVSLRRRQHPGLRRPEAHSRRRARQLGALQPGDRAAIFTSSCTLSLDFTNDRAKLQDALSRLQSRPRQSAASRRPRHSS